MKKIAFLLLLLSVFHRVNAQKENDKSFFNPEKNDVQNIQEILNKNNNRFIANCTSSITVTVTLDNNPEETAIILSVPGSGIFEYETFENNLPGSTHVKNFVLPNYLNGDFLVTVYDRGGNGFTSGGYSISDGNNTYSGSTFDFTVAYQFCKNNSTQTLDTIHPIGANNAQANNISTNSALITWNAGTDNSGLVGYAISNDPIITSSNVLYENILANQYQINNLQPNTTYTYYIITQDAAYNIANSLAAVTFTTLPITPVVLHEGYFETGWDGWIDGGVDCKRVNNPSRSYEGNYSIRLRDNSGIASSMTSPNLDFSSYNEVGIDFSFYVFSMENNEDFFLEYFDGTNWSIIASYTKGTDFMNGQFYNHVVVLNSSNHIFSQNSKLRFRCDASGNKDHIYIDAIKISGTTATFPVTNVIIESNNSLVANQPIEELDTSKSTIQNKEVALKLFPNPTSSYFKIRSKNSDAITKVEIYNLNGNMVKSFNKRTNLYSTEDLDKGIYIVNIYKNGEVLYKKIIKD